MFSLSDRTVFISLFDLSSVEGGTTSQSDPPLPYLNVSTLFHHRKKIILLCDYVAYCIFIGKSSVKKLWQACFKEN